MEGQSPASVADQILSKAGFKLDIRSALIKEISNLNYDFYDRLPSMSRLFLFRQRPLHFPSDFHSRGRFQLFDQTHIRNGERLTYVDRNFGRLWYFIRVLRKRYHLLKFLLGFWKLAILRPKLFSALV